MANHNSGLSDQKVGQWRRGTGRKQGQKGTVFEKRLQNTELSQKAAVKEQ